MENLHKPSRRIHSPRRSRTSGASPSLQIPIASSQNAMPSSPQLASTRKGKKTTKKSARTPATIRRPRKRSLVVESADEAEATAAPQLQADQDEQAAEAPQINVAADSVADAVDTENPASRIVGHTITFRTSPQTPLGVQQEEEPVSSMTRAIQIMVPVTSPAAQAAQENATPVASAVTLNTPAASCPPPAYPVPSPPCDAPAPLTPPLVEQTSPVPDSTPQASVTTPEVPRAIAG